MTVARQQPAIRAYAKMQSLVRAKSSRPTARDQLTERVSSALAAFDDWSTKHRDTIEKCRQAVHDVVTLARIFEEARRIEYTLRAAQILAKEAATLAHFGMNDADQRLVAANLCRFVMKSRSSTAQGREIARTLLQTLGSP